jgi:hypothetical protein
MNAMTVFHGIQVHRGCVLCGFDWRTGESNPEFGQLFGKVHFKDRDAALARDSMWTYYRAQRFIQDGEIPTKHSDRERSQMILHSNVLDSEHGPPICPTLMTPVQIRSSYIDRKNSAKARILHRLLQVPDTQSQISLVPNPVHESPNLPFVNSDSVEQRAARQAGEAALLKNAMLFHKEREQADLESGDSSVDDGKNDWIDNGDNSSDVDDEY